MPVWLRSIPKMQKFCRRMRQLCRGRKAIEEFWRSAANALGLTDIMLKTVDLEVSGDIAYEIGEADLKLDSGQAKAKYLVVWLRSRDGQWRLHRDIWNSMPAG